MGLGNLGITELLFLPVFLTVVFAAFALPGWMICRKTGNPGLLGLAFLIPVVNVLAWLYLAFSKWPIERELEEMRGETVAHRN